jgi:hypothetical protein
MQCSNCCKYGHRAATANENPDAENVQENTIRRNAADNSSMRP